MFETTGEILILVGAAIALIGLIIWLSPRVPFLGNLPGDVSYQSDGVSVFIPITTCILVSIILTIVANIVIYLFAK